LWGVDPKNVGIPGAFDLGSKVYFTDSVVNLDDYIGTRFVINLSYESMENLEPIYTSPNESFYNTYAVMYANVVEETPPPIALDSLRERVCRLNNVHGKCS
jgi:hypothetical protein